MTAGGKVTVTFKVSKTNRRDVLGQGSVTVNVPLELCMLATRPKGPQINATSGNVVWSGVNFNKRGTRTFRVKARVQSSYSLSSAAFSAHADITALECSSAPAPVEVRELLGRPLGTESSWSYHTCEGDFDHPIGKSQLPCNQNPMK